MKFIYGFPQIFTEHLVLITAVAAFFDCLLCTTQHSKHCHLLTALIHTGPYDIDTVIIPTSYVRKPRHR